MINTGLLVAYALAWIVPVVIGYVWMGLALSALLRKLSDRPAHAWIPVLRWVAAARAARMSTVPVLIARIIGLLGALTAGAGVALVFMNAPDVPGISRALMIGGGLAGLLGGLVGWVLWIYGSGTIEMRLRAPAALSWLAAISPVIWASVMGWGKYGRSGTVEPLRTADAPADDAASSPEASGTFETRGSRFALGGAESTSPLAEPSGVRAAPATWASVSAASAPRSEPSAPSAPAAARPAPSSPAPPQPAAPSTPSAPPAVSQPSGAQPGAPASPAPAPGGASQSGAAPGGQAGLGMLPPGWGQAPAEPAAAEDDRTIAPPADESAWTAAAREERPSPVSGPAASSAPAAPSAASESAAAAAAPSQPSAPDEPAPASSPAQPSASAELNTISTRTSPSAPIAPSVQSAPSEPSAPAEPSAAQAPAPADPARASAPSEPYTGPVSPYLTGPQTPPSAPAPAGADVPFQEPDPTGSLPIVGAWDAVDSFPDEEPSPASPASSPEPPSPEPAPASTAPAPTTPERSEPTPAAPVAPAPGASAPGAPEVTAPGTPAAADPAPPAAAPASAFAPLPPVAGAATSAAPGGSASPADDDEDDRTVIAQRRKDSWVLEVQGGARYPLPDGPVTVGRATATPSPGRLGVDDATRTMSKVHAQLRPADGRWLVKDLGSTNGTYLRDDAGEHPVTGDDEAVVEGTLLLGDLEVRIVVEEAGA